MSDVILKDNENVTVAVSALDALGATLAVSFDPGTVVATFADGSAFQVVVSPDETSINVKALGPIVTGDVLTVSGSIAGVALTPASLTFDVEAGSPVAVSLSVGTPAVN